MDDHLNPVHRSLEKTIDFSTAIVVDSMDAVYRDVALARCDCGGKIFPTGPVTLRPQSNHPGNIRYKLMFVFCTTCSEEGKRLYALNVSSNEYLLEQNQAISEIPRWGYLISGNPIDPELEIS